jgi:ribosomal protein S18 acetylase RimI-like enzyme
MGGDGAFAWRPIGPGDAKDWAGLLNTISAADRDWEYFSEQDLLEDFSDPYLDFARGSVAVYHGGTMAGYGLLACRTSAEPVHEMRYHGGVHPAYRGRGLGGRLLDWAETAAIPLHHERYPGRPLSLSGLCLSPITTAVALYAAHGYRPSRWFHEMTRDLSAALPIALVGTRRAGRNRGIASALLLRALTGARAAGFVSASLGVDADSPTGALGLYQRAGFTVMLTSVTNTKPLLEAQPEGTPPAGH